MAVAIAKLPCILLTASVIMYLIFFMLMSHVLLNTFNISLSNPALPSVIQCVFCYQLGNAVSIALVYHSDFPCGYSGVVRHFHTFSVTGDY